MRLYKLIDKESYLEICKLAKKNNFWVKRSLISFLGGGFLCLLFEGLNLVFQHYKLLPDDKIPLAILFIFIFITVFLTSIGVYDKLSQYLGAGLFIPISGFANAMSSAALEYKKEGLIQGIGSNMFKLAGSVVVYGVFSSIVLGVVLVILK